MAQGEGDESRNGQLAAELQRVTPDYEARRMAQEALFKLDAHERECRAQRDASRQWQESMARMMEDHRGDMRGECIEIKAIIATHASADTSFQDGINKKLGGWNKFLMGVMGSAIVALALALLALGGHH